ncbi:MAG: YIP1 family protein [Acetatifactor sp.]|nr:YIP1 family protein [Acetatifactor sp.]
MKKAWKKLFVSLTALLLFLGVAADSIKVQADSPYKTYTIDGYGYVTETQTAYLPYETITKIGEEALIGPTDFTLTDDGYMYILDSGNGRVVVSDMEASLIATFGEGILVNPRGMYVTGDHICYVADRDARSIFVFDENGELIQTYGKPDHPLYGGDLDFLPLKVVVNESGTMYVICESNNNGIVQISPVEGGTFLGYFGTNSTSASLWRIIWRAIQTDAQRAKSQGNLPSTPDNMAIDEKGLIYTVTRGEKYETLKRLNIAGINMIECDSYEAVPAAVAVGNHDNVFVASTNGYIYEYNNEGDLLFVFGGSDDGQQRIGLSTKVEAIQIDNNDKIYLLDSDKAQIQVFEPTEFTRHLHEALFLFSKGRYTESKEPLSQVLRMNNLFDYANMAMGRALIQEEDYDSAIRYAKLAKDYDGYSDAFWEIRNNWLKRNLVTVIILIVAIWLVKKFLTLADKKWGILKKPKAALKSFGELKLMRELRYMFYFIRHPIDGCYGIKRQNQVSLTSANIILFVGILFYIINKYFCGFLFKTVREGYYDIFSDVGLLLVALFLITGCNYLMCTINDGEGKLKHIYCSFIYSLTPYLVFMPVIFVISHVVTYNEAFFVEFATLFMFVWIAILLFISIREINNYTIKETVKIIGLTVFTILIALLLAFIIYVLWSQVFDFIQSLFGEVVYKIGN